jgi:hypothetical protein
MTVKSRLPSPSLVVALVALVMACAGSARRHPLITGKQIKNRTLRTKDLHASAAQALKGQKGDPGAPGQVGPSDVYSARAATVTPANNTAALSLDVPAGAERVRVPAPPDGVRPQPKHDGQDRAISVVRVGALH